MTILKFSMRTKRYVASRGMFLDTNKAVMMGHRHEHVHVVWLKKHCVSAEEHLITFQEGDIFNLHIPAWDLS